MAPPPTRAGEGLLRWRDRLLCSPRFQRHAARFLPTRWLARRRAAELFQLSAGFVYSQVLAACVQLRLLELLAPGPLPVAAIADRIDLPEDGARRLLAAATALRLLQRRGGDGYGLGELGAAMLGNPSIAAMVDHHQRLYADLAEPLALLRRRGQTRLAAFWPYAGGAVDGSAAVAGYSELMAASQAMLADGVLDACPLGQHRHLLDVAGGQGAFAAAALSRWPGLEATVFDLPPVAERALAQLAAAGFGARARAVGGDMFREPLPRGADLVSLVRVLHDHDDGPALALLRSVRAILPAGGRLLVAEPLAATPGAEPVGDAYFGMYLWAMGSGRPRTRQDLFELMRQAGFRACRERRTALPILVRVLEART